MILASQIKAGILSWSAAAWGRQVSTLVLYTVAARMLVPEEIGTFAIANTIFLLFEYAIFDSISEAVVQREDLGSPHLGAATFMAACAATCVMLLSFSLSGRISSLLDAPDLAHIMPWMATPVSIVCLSAAYSGILRRQGHFHLMSALSVVAALVAAFVGIVLLLLNVGLFSLVAYFAVEKLILGIGTIVCGLRHPTSRFSRRHIYDLASYTAVVFGQRATYFLRSEVDKILIAFLWGADVLGVYQFAVKLSDSLQSILLSPSSKLFFVSYARLQGKAEQLQRAFLNSVRTVAFFTFPSFLGLAAVAPEVVHILFGEKWASSGLILEILAVSGVPMVLSVISSTALSAVGKPRAALLVELAAATVGICLLTIFAQFGVVWLAVSFVCREIIAATIYGFVLRATIGASLRDYTASFTPYLITSFVMLVLLAALRAIVPLTLSTPLLLMTITGTGVIFYGSIMIVVSEPLRQRMALMVMSVLRRREFDS